MAQIERAANRGNPRLKDILKALPTMSKGERRMLLDGLCQHPDALEDLQDILVLLERRHEPPRPYDGFAAELKADGSL